MSRKLKRGAVKREGSEFVGAWVPESMAIGIDQAVQRLDLDRSKFLRRALEEKIAKTIGATAKSPNA